MKTLVLVIVVILVAIGGYYGYRQLSKPKPAETPVVETQEEPEIIPEPAAPVVRSEPPVMTNPVRTVTRRATPATAPKPTGEWKAGLDAILASAEKTPQEKIQELKAFFSKLEESEAEQAVQDLTLRVQDEGYGFIKPLAVDPTLPEPVRDEFMVDMLNRPNSIKLPLFLEIARNPDHPDNESAYDSLEIFTGLKLGADWNAWEKGIATWLKENPDQLRRRKTPAEVN